MGYCGEVMSACGVINIDFSSTNIVAVSGDGPNICGHTLLNTGSRGGYYFHVAGLYDYPRYMSETDYRQYLDEAGKNELNRVSIEISDPTSALLYLEGTMSNKWFWMVLPNNCVSFVEEVLKAGGSNWSSVTNCPVLAADVIPSKLRQFYQRMHAYQAYRGY